MSDEDGSGMSDEDAPVRSNGVFYRHTTNVMCIEC
jgi:hypothetical protein